MTTQDRTLVCRTCGREFVWSVKDQEFYASKGFAEPRHCSECRARRKREAAEAESTGVHQGEAGVDRSGPRTGVGRHPSSRTREWTEVTCASCGRPTQVPFKPVSGRPIYCRECFANVRRGQSGHLEGDFERNPENRYESDSPHQDHNESATVGSSQETDPPEFDPGPLPEIEPAPDEEGEITRADYIPMSISFGASPEEPNPTFKD